MFMVVTGTIDRLINGFSAMSLVVYGMTVAGVVILRVTHQKEPRLFKVPRYPLVKPPFMCVLFIGLQAWFILPIAVAMSIFCGFLVLAPFFNAKVVDIVGPISALCFTLLGIPVYILLVMEHPRKIRPNIVDRLSSMSQFQRIFILWPFNFIGFVSVYVNNVLNTRTTRELPTKD